MRLNYQQILKDNPAHYHGLNNDWSIHTWEIAISDSYTTHVFEIPGSSSLSIHDVAMIISDALLNSTRIT